MAHKPDKNLSIEEIIAQAEGQTSRAPLDQTITDAQGNFQGRITQPGSAPPQESPTQLPEGLQQQLARGLGDVAGAGAALPSLGIDRDPQRRSGSPLEARLGSTLSLTPSEQRLEDGRSLVKLEEAAGKDEGFRFTDLFNVVGALSSDPDVAANSIGRAFERAGAGEFRSPEERRAAQLQQKADAQKAMGLLLEQGRVRRSDNRLDFNKEKFTENKGLRKQDREIQKERIKLAKTKGERLERQAELDQLDRTADRDALADTILVGAGQMFSGGSSKAIAEKLKISRAAASQMLSDVAALPADQRKEAAEQLAEKFSPSGESGGDDIVTLSSGRKFNKTQNKFVE